MNIDPPPLETTGAESRANARGYEISRVNTRGRGSQLLDHSIVTAWLKDPNPKRRFIRKIGQ